MEINQIVEGIGKTFEEFKAANDKRLAEIEKKGSSDVVLTEKVNRMSAALGELDSLKSQVEKLETRQVRPQLGADGREIKAEVVEHKQAFMRFMRKGLDAGLGDLERKALQIAAPADGGYALPEEIDRTINSLLVDLSPMRALASKVQVSTTDYKKLVSLGGAASGWVGETASRPPTNTPTLAEVPAFMGEIYANPQATQTMLDDVFFDAEAWLSSEVATEFARAEGIAFMTGDGVNKPKGLLAYTTAATADGVRAFGTIEHVPTGVAGGWAASSPGDALISLTYKVKAGHRAGAQFMMSKNLLAEARMFKDSAGQYLWQPSLAAGQPSSFSGYPIVENEVMPAKGANSLSVAFGNFAAAYTVVDRIGTRVLRDAYTNKPYIGYYTTKRVGGMLHNSEAVKLLKFSAT